MSPRIDLGALKQVTASEYLLRFVFGGVVTVCTGAIAQVFGPCIGGLFLAFPAILPASITLLKRHEGRRQAIAGVHGARLGAAALIVFAAVAGMLSDRGYAPAITLVLATAAWGACSVAIWAAFFRPARTQRKKSALVKAGRGKIM